MQAYNLEQGHKSMVKVKDVKRYYVAQPYVAS